MNITKSTCKLHTYYNFCIDVKDEQSAVCWLISNVSPNKNGNRYYMSSDNWHAKTCSRITSLIGFTFVEKKVPLHYSVTIIDDQNMALAFKLTFDEVSIGEMD